MFTPANDQEDSILRAAQLSLHARVDDAHHATWEHSSLVQRTLALCGDYPLSVRGVPTPASWAWRLVLGPVGGSYRYRFSWLKRMRGHGGHVVSAAISPITCARNS